MGEANQIDIESMTSCLRKEGRIYDAAILAADPHSVVTEVLIVPRGFSSVSEVRELVCRILNSVPPENLQIVLVNSIPRKQDGTLDELRVGNIKRRSGAVHRYVPATTKMEECLVGLIDEILPDRQISMTDNPLTLGGDSLTALHFTALIGERLGVEISEQDIFGMETIQQLAIDIERYSDRHENSRRNS